MGIGLKISKTGILREYLLQLVQILRQDFVLIAHFTM